MSEHDPRDMGDDELVSNLRAAVAAHQQYLDEQLAAVKAGRRIDLFDLDELRDELGDDVVDALMVAWREPPKLRE